MKKIMFSFLLSLFAFKAFATGSVLLEIPNIPEEEIEELTEILGKTAEEYRNLDIKFEAKDDCDCGHKYTFIDFVMSALNLRVHSRDFLVKNMFDPRNVHRDGSKPMLCPECGVKKVTPCMYSYNKWACQDG